MQAKSKKLIQESQYIMKKRELGFNFIQHDNM